MIDPDKLDKLRWECEEKLMSQCKEAEQRAKERGQMFYCNCPNPDNWTEEECLEFLGEEE